MPVMRRAVRALVLALLPATVLAAEPVRVAVLELDAPALDEPTRHLLDSVLLGEAGKVEGLAVVGTADVRAMLSLEQKKQLLGCDSDACFTELGAALGARYAASGSMARAGDLWFVNLRVIDTRTATVVGRVSREVHGGDPLLIVDATREATRELLSPLSPSQPLWRRGWFWAVVGAVAVGGGVAWAVQPAERHGNATFDFGVAPAPAP